MIVAQSCLTLCNPVACSPPSFSAHGILQGRILEWVTIPFSRDLPDLGIKPGSPALQSDSLPSEPPEKPGWGVFTTDLLSLLLLLLLPDNSYLFLHSFVPLRLLLRPVQGQTLWPGLDHKMA